MLAMLLVSASTSDIVDVTNETREVELKTEFEPDTFSDIAITPDVDVASGAPAIENTVIIGVSVVTVPLLDDVDADGVVSNATLPVVDAIREGVVAAIGPGDIDSLHIHAPVPSHIVLSDVLAHGTSPSHCSISDRGTNPTPHSDPS